MELRDDYSHLVAKFDDIVSSATPTIVAVRKAGLLLREVVKRCGSDPMRRRMLEGARGSYQAMKDRHRELVKAEWASNRAVKLRIITAMNAAAAVRDPLVFHENISGCRALWLQTGPTGPDTQLLVSAYRAADNGFREACRARIKA